MTNHDDSLAEHITSRMDLYSRRHVDMILKDERTLTDDLAAALNHLLFHADPSPADEAEIEVVLARYREARQQ